MKKLSKIIISIALMLVMAMPVLMSGCGPEEGITLYSTFKTEYQVGDSLDLDNGKIEYTDEDGKKTIVAITSSMVSSFSTNSTGDKELIITYKGFSITVEYTVIKKLNLKNGVYRFEQYADVTDVSLLLYFSSPNVVKMGQGTVGAGMVAEGTYTKSYENDNWIITGTLTMLNGYTSTMYLTITNITENSLDMVYSDGTQTSEKVTFTYYTV